jgi:hypothetical protein
MRVVNYKIRTIFQVLKTRKGRVAEVEIFARLLPHPGVAGPGLPARSSVCRCHQTGQSDGSRAGKQA